MICTAPGGRAVTAALGPVVVGRHAMRLPPAGTGLQHPVPGFAMTPLNARPSSDPEKAAAPPRPHDDRAGRPGRRLRGRSGIPDQPRLRLHHRTRTRRRRRTLRPPEPHRPPPPAIRPRLRPPRRPSESCRVPYVRIHTEARQPAEIDDRGPVRAGHRTHGVRTDADHRVGTKTAPDRPAGRTWRTDLAETAQARRGDEADRAVAGDGTGGGPARGDRLPGPVHDERAAQHVRDTAVVPGRHLSRRPGERAAARTLPRRTVRLPHRPHVPATPAGMHGQAPAPRPARPRTRAPRTRSRPARTNPGLTGPDRA